MVLALVLSARVLCGLTGASPPLCCAPRTPVPIMAAAASTRAGPDAARERRLLRGVIQEALEAQARKRDALEQQLARTASAEDYADHAEASEKASKLEAKAQRRAQLVPQRLEEVARAEALLVELSLRLRERQSGAAVRAELEALGLGARLASFDVNAAALSQWGRPPGFDGLVLESPRGVPILVGRRSFSDELLRRVGRGSDLWFQARETRGSRVLLRTSMVRSLSRSSRECVEMAADVAAFFSDARWCADVSVMYTDSKHVAKRGSRVGQMKESKKLGAILASPERVEAAAREAQEEQGWL